MRRRIPVLPPFLFVCIFNSFPIHIRTVCFPRNNNVARVCTFYYQHIHRTSLFLLSESINVHSNNPCHYFRWHKHLDTAFIAKINLLLELYYSLVFISLYWISLTDFSIFLFLGESASSYINFKTVELNIQ